jgi:hypothetical protein
MAFQECLDDAFALEVLGILERCDVDPVSHLSARTSIRQVPLAESVACDYPDIVLLVSIQAWLCSE